MRVGFPRSCRGDQFLCRETERLWREGHAFGAVEREQHDDKQRNEQEDDHKAEHQRGK